MVYSYDIAIYWIYWITSTAKWNTENKQILSLDEKSLSKLTKNIWAF